MNFKGPINPGRTTIGDVATADRGYIRLHIIGDVVEFDCASVDLATLSVVPIDAGTSTLWPAAAVLEVQCTANGLDWAGAKTSDFNGGDVRNDIDVASMVRIRVRVKTITSDTGNFKAEVSFSGKRASISPS